MKQVQLNYTTIGTASNPALFMVHGMLMSNDMWQLNNSLAQHFYLVQVELWGHGNSMVADNPNCYLPDFYAQQIDNIRKKLGIERCYLVGQSYGAALVLHYAKNYPQHCQNIFISNSMSALAKSFSNDILLNAVAKISTSADLKKLPIHPIHARKLPATLKEKLSTIANNVSIVAFKQALYAANKLSCHDFIGGLSMPVYLINGIEEKNFQPCVQQLKDQHPHIHITDIAAGHAPNLECADAFNRVLIDALSLSNNASRVQYETS